jgi:hypothetical protein
MSRRTRTVSPTTKTQTGVRIDARLIKTLKALAQLQDTALGELFENLVQSALAGTPAWSGEFLQRAHEFAAIYGWSGEAPGGQS